MHLVRNTFLAIVISGSLLGCQPEAPQPSNAGLPVQILTVQATVVPETIQLSGRLTASNIAEIRPQVTGIIQKRFFTEGGFVKAGEPLYQIQPDIFDASYQSALASLERARANAATSNARAERFKQLIDSQAVSKQDYDDAIAQAKLANADVLAAQAAVKTAYTNVTFARITAPISGYISKSSVTQGALVTTNQAAPLATIQQMDPIYVDMSQNSSEARKLQEKLASGKAIKVRLLMEDNTFYEHEGELKFSERTVDPSTGNVSIRAVFNNAESKLLPGVFTQTQLYLGDIPQAISVPQAAVQQSPQGDAFVYVVNSQSMAEVRNVRVSGLNDGNYIIREGLATGDKVIVSNLIRVRPGIPVQNVADLGKPAAAAEVPMPEESKPAESKPEESKAVETPPPAAPESKQETPASTQ